ncbi:MAG: dTDP-4-dehydrorhamnose reductase, partial [Lachnospiraceae bacterium]|nr:dTDP-4-dehydrorhamnose reductase [Lachnospiraceae bacterium]
MSKILITGCNGQLGRAIQNEYNGEAEFILSDMMELPDVMKLDIGNEDEVRRIAGIVKPDIIINCAAYTNVDGCEQHEEDAYRANAIGPKNLAMVARECDATLVHISTDYVFDGAATEPIREEDIPNPVSAYGRTKLAGEKFVQEEAVKYFILRTAWLYGDGKNFVRTMLALSETHDEVSVVCDQKGSPTSTVELAKVIRYLLGTGEYGIYHATCEGETNWAAFAEEIFREAGKSTKVNYVTSEEYAAMNPAAANRPSYSVLENA